jgi:hypothetical protein
MFFERDLTMTFSELPLFEAVHDAYRILRSPRSDAWLVDEEHKEVLYRTVQGNLPRNAFATMEQILQAWSLYGKSSGVNDGEQKKLELVILTARAHGRKCFWAGRGLGDCTSELNLDRLIPGSRGGRYVVENCVLACSFHNGRRGDSSVESYLLSAK